MLERREGNARGKLERWPRDGRPRNAGARSSNGRGTARSTGEKCSRHGRAMAETWPTEKCWGALEQWPRRRARNARGTLERWPRNAREMAEKFSRHARSMAESQLERRERNARVMLERQQWGEWGKWVRASEYFTEVNKISQKIFLYPSSAILMFTGVRWPNVRLYL